MSFASIESPFAEAASGIPDRSAKEYDLAMMEKPAIYVIVVAAAIGYAGDYFGIAWLFYASLALFSLWLIAWGIEIAVKGEIAMINQDYGRREFFSGAAAGLWAAMIIAIGLLLLFYTGLEIGSPGGSESFFDRLFETSSGWGAAIALAGLFLTALGLIRLLSGSAFGPDAGRWIEFRFRFAGAIYLLGGMFCLAWAAGLIFAPQLLQALWDGLLRALLSVLGLP